MSLLLECRIAKHMHKQHQIKYWPAEHDEGCSLYPEKGPKISKFCE